MFFTEHSGTATYRAHNQAMQSSMATRGRLQTNQLPNVIRSDWGSRKTSRAARSSRLAGLPMSDPMPPMFAPQMMHRQARVAALRDWGGEREKAEAADSLEAGEIAPPSRTDLASGNRASTLMALGRNRESRAGARSNPQSVRPSRSRFPAARPNRCGTM